MSQLPTGTVSFVFTDIEGSTRLLQDLGDRWEQVLADHHRILRDAWSRSGGVEVATEGDAFFVVFDRAPAAVAAAVAGQRGLATHRWPDDGPVRVRMGIHTGEGVLGVDNYVGLDVHRAARIAAAAHGGQVLVSGATRAMTAGSLPEGVTLADLGEHRLKDMPGPEPLAQLVIEGIPAEFPPIRSLEAPTNLPSERTGFVGRREELARAADLLEETRLLTLTGPGGTGKTRLALQLGRNALPRFSGGVFFVDLSPIEDPEVVAPTIATAIGVREEGARSILSRLQDHFRDRQALLILDNFEQVLAAAGIVSELLEAAPRLRVVVTSRSPLHLTGEQELAVPPLATPAADGLDPAGLLDASEAVALFVQRARAVDPTFELTGANARAVAEICAHLDGLPLAIELAASRLRMLSPQVLLERLHDRLGVLTGGPRDAPGRHQSLREAIAWSHEMLSPTEQVAFRRLATFTGGWTFASADAVANGSEGDRIDSMTALESLLDHSLIRRAEGGGGVRFAMFETIYEFAREQLEAHGEAPAVEASHTEYFLALAEAAEPQLRGEDQKRWLDELELEHDNLRAALRRAVDDGRADIGLRMVAALWRFWHLHGHLAEGLRWTQEVFALPGADERNALRIKGLTALGGLVYWQEDIPGFTRAYEEALDIAREIGDRPAEALGLYNLAFAPAYQGDMATAVAMFEESAALFEEVGDRRGLADTLWILGILSRLGGDVPKSRALAEESLRMHRERGDPFGATVALYALGRTAFAQGDVATARSAFHEALDHDEQAGSGTGLGVVLDNLAAQASVRGDHLRAVRLRGASEGIKRAAGGHAPPALIDIPDPREPAREALSEEAIAALWDEGLAMSREQAIAYARED